MRIIITYASAGAGHIKAAEALIAYLKLHCKEAEVEIIDVLDNSTSFFRSSYNLGYNFLIYHAAFLWAAAFWLTAFKPLRWLSRFLASVFNYWNTKKFARLLIERNADYIISTHFLSSEIAARLKKSNQITSRVVTVITDFGVHPFWLTKRTDIYVAASDFTKSLLVNEGIDVKNIRVFGIPVDLKFSNAFIKEDLCRKFNITAEKFTLLVMTGSFGIGPIGKIVELLKDEVQILVVCAKNKRLFDSLNEKAIPNVRVFSFIDNVEELMAVSDIMVTKPGGLSCAELLTMELFPIFICAIPGQEAANANIMEKAGIGLSAVNANEVCKIVLAYKENPRKLVELRQKIRQIKKPFAAKELCDAVCKGSV